MKKNIYIVIVIAILSAGFVVWSAQTKGLSQARGEQGVVTQDDGAVHKGENKNSNKPSNLIGAHDIGFFISDNWSVVSRQEVDDEVVVNLKNSKGQQTVMTVFEYKDINEAGSGRFFLGKTKYGEGARYSLVTTENLSRDLIIFSGYPVSDSQGGSKETVSKYFEISFSPTSGFEKDIEEIINSVYPLWIIE